jgi:succinoglycan biosynthesis protein ExoV
MNLFFCKVDGGNFGDDMNGWFWDELFPEHTEIATDTTLFGIGSILWRANFTGHNKVVVMGSGSGYGVIPNELPDGTQIGFVRGPRTARLLNLDADMAITDPAIMVSTFERFKDVKKTDDVIFIPHVGTAKLPLNWERVAERAGVKYLSPANESNAVIRQLAGAKLVLAESLHGAIIADAFQVPWVPVSVSPTFNNHKWQDWSDSLEIEIEIQEFLIGMKKARSRLAQVKRALGYRKPAAAENAAKVMPHGTHVAPTFSEQDKNVARKWVSRLSPAIETLLVQDLKSAKRSKGYRSSKGILMQRQSQISERVDQIREQLAN